MNDISRTDTLIGKRYQKLVAPQIASSLVKSLMVFMDSLLAGQFIGMTALAAIALTAPILAIDEMLHCLLGAGLSLQVSQAVGQENRAKANRIVAATLGAVLLVYVLIFLPVLILIRHILGFFSTDGTLVTMACAYMIPILITMPLFEIMLCLEKAYLIDGHEKLFATRPMLTGTLNVLLDIVFTAVLHAGIVGLAFASIISTLAGYAITLSHGFHRDCTIHPDFYVLLTPLECLGYVRENLLRGGTYAIDEGSRGLIEMLICKLLSSQGGVTALAAWGIFTQIQSIADAIGNGINNEASLLGGLLYSEGDSHGCRTVFSKSRRYNHISSIFLMVLILLFAPQISQLMNIETDALTECSRLLCLACPALAAEAVLMYRVMVATVLQQYNFSYRASITEKLLILLGVSLGALFHAEGIFVGYAAAELIALLLLDGKAKIGGKTEKSCDSQLSVFGENELKDYSLFLVPEEIVRASIDLEAYIRDRGYPQIISRRLALFVEESCQLVCAKNPGRAVQADIRFCICEEKLVLTIMDDGMPYNLSRRETQGSDPDDLEHLILVRLANRVSYDRILSLNHLVVELQIRHPGQEGMVCS